MFQTSCKARLWTRDFAAAASRFANDHSQAREWKSQASNGEWSTAAWSAALTIFSSAQPEGGKAFWQFSRCSLDRSNRRCFRPVSETTNLWSSPMIEEDSLHENTAQAGLGARTAPTTKRIVLFAKSTMAVQATYNENGTSRRSLLRNRNRGSTWTKMKA